MSPSTILKSGVITLAILGAAAFSYGQLTQAAPKADTAVTAVSSQAMTIRAGDFSGRSDHVTKGQVSLNKTAQGYQLVFSEDFFLDGAPDPVVGFGLNGEYKADSKVASLKNKTGAQTYTLPASFTPSDFNEVYVWCEKFSVPLGAAALTGA